MTIKSLSIVDYVVMAGVLAVSVFIGIFTACTGTKQRTTTEFLVGDRSMELFPVSLSVLATFTSAITVLGMPEESYRYGIDFWWMLLPITLMIPAVAHLYLPIFYKLQITSVYEYIGLRFNNIVRLLTSSIYAIQMFTYMSIVLYAPALAISHMTGLSVWTSVLTTGLVCTFYTSIGGIKAVVWTDMFQMLLILACLLSVVIQGTMLLGVQFIWDKNIEGSRLHLPDYSIDPLKRHTVWSFIFGGYFIWLYIYGINQSMVQRYVALPSLRKAQLCVWLNYPMLVLIISLTSAVGLVLYAFYHDCDPYSAGKISGREQILPYFVMTKLAKFQGLPGLFLSGLFCGALSTLSSGMNSLAAVTVTDVIRPYFGGIEENVATHVTKFLVFFYGALCIGFVSIIERLGSVLLVTATFFGIIGGPLAGIFTLGIFFPWANSKGASIGLVLGLFLSMWIGVCELIYKPYHEQPPVSIAGCSINPVDMFTDGVQKDGALLNDLINKNKSAIMNNGSFATTPEMDILKNKSTVQPSIFGTVSVEKVEDFVEDPLTQLFNANESINELRTKRNAPVPLAQAYMSPEEEHEEGKRRNKEIPVLYRISYLWFSGIGCLTTVIIGLIASFITGMQDPYDLDPRLICDIAESFCCCLPAFMREMMWPNVGLDYISEDAAIALLKRKSPPPEIITTEADELDENLKGTKGRIVHFTEGNDQPNDDELYPFDTSDIPYGVIVNQDYEDFSKMANGNEHEQLNLSPQTESSANSDRKLKLKTAALLSYRNRSHTLPTDVVHPKQKNPYDAKYANHRHKYNNRGNEIETIQLKEMGHSKPQTPMKNQIRRGSLERQLSDKSRDSFRSTERQSSIDRTRESFRSNDRQPSIDRNRDSFRITGRQPSMDRTRDSFKNSDRKSSVERTKDSFRNSERPVDEQKKTRPNYLSGVSDQSVRLGNRTSSLANRGNQRHRPSEKREYRQPEKTQKRPYKRLLSHEAEKKLNLRDRTHVKTGVMSD